MSEHDDALEIEIRLASRREPSDALRRRVLRSLSAERSAERGRRLRAERIAGGALALAAGALLVARLVGPIRAGRARAPVGEAASLETLRGASSRLASELGLEEREDVRLALLAFGGAELPRVAPTLHPYAAQGVGR